MMLEETYNNITTIGNGGFGTVFRAKHKVTGIFRAIKCTSFDPVHQAVARREVENLIRLSQYRHVNIVQYETCWIQDLASVTNAAVKRVLDTAKGTAKSNKILCIVMELCDGSLADHLRDVNRKFFDGPQVCEPARAIETMKETGQKILRHGKCYPPAVESEQFNICQQICTGLKYLHSLKIAHRDLKPGNILFVTNSDGSQTFKIADFGLAKVIILSGKNTPCGTPFYSSPEQMKAEKSGRSSDIYSLAIILLEILYPFSQLPELVHWLKEFKKKSALPAEFVHAYPALSPLIMRMIQDNRKARPFIDEVLAAVTTDAPNQNSPPQVLPNVSAEPINRQAANGRKERCCLI